MEMRCVLRVFLVFLLGVLSTPSFAKTVVFWQPGFPAADSPAPEAAGLRAGFAGAEFVDAAGLKAALEKGETNLLVMPYGSAWPEGDWDAILKYLDRGGNLIVLGERRSRGRRMRMRVDGVCGRRAWRNRWNFLFTTIRRRRGHTMLGHLRG